MATSYVIASLLVGVIYCAAIEHPGSRNYRSDNYDVNVVVKPNFVKLHPGETVAIRCRAKGSSKVGDVGDLPYVHFYRLLDPNTVMPLGSGYPGVRIQSDVPNHKNKLAHSKRRRHVHYNRTIKRIILEKEAYNTLENGENIFYCKGSNFYSKSKPVYFVVWKVPSSDYADYS